MKQKLIEILSANPRTLPDLRLVKSLNLPNWYIAAGYVRNQVWDHLHGMKFSRPFNDVDVIYFDKSDIREETEKTFERQLREANHELNWSVKNQARMHVRNQDSPYIDVEDAMKRWPETATAVGITLTDNGMIEIIAPHGLDDLFQLKVKKSPYYKDKDRFLERVHSKRWLEIWPQLTLQV